MVTPSNDLSEVIDTACLATDARWDCVSVALACLEMLGEMKDSLYLGKHNTCDHSWVASEPYKTISDGEAKIHCKWCHESGTVTISGYGL